MNNPWLIAALIEHDQERIRQEIKQIRLEEEALRAGRTQEKTKKTRFYRPRLLMLVVPTFVKRMFCLGR